LRTNGSKSEHLISTYVQLGREEAPLASRFPFRWKYRFLVKNPANPNSHLLLAPVVRRWQLLEKRAGWEMSAREPTPPRAWRPQEKNPRDPPEVKSRKTREGFIPAPAKRGQFCQNSRKKIKQIPDKMDEAAKRERFLLKIPARIFSPHFCPAAWRGGRIFTLFFFLNRTISEIFLILVDQELRKIRFEPFTRPVLPRSGNAAVLPVRITPPATNLRGNS